MPRLPPWLHNVMPALPILLLAVCQQLSSGPGCHLWAVLSLCWSLSDKRRRAFSLFSLFAAVCWHCCIPGGSNYAVTGPVFGLLQPCSLAANHASLQTSHFSPPPKKKQHIYTPPTTETVHLSRLMRVHYNCCPFHKPASGVTHFLELVYNTVSLKKKYNQTDTQYNYA